MQYRFLGNSRIDASVIGLGTWAIGGWMWGGTEENEAVRAIQSSLDHGINLVDTAPMYGYGRSEEIVGRAIAKRRDEVILATKCGLVWDREQGEFFFHATPLGMASQPSEKKIYRYLGPESIRREIEQSLQRLGTDYIDLYQTHWQEHTTPIEDTIGELLKLKDEGKIRAIGVSNASLDQMKAYGLIDTAQELYNMLDRQIASNGVLNHCRDNNIAVLAYSPLANGLLTGSLSPDREFGEGDLRRSTPRFSVENRERIQACLEELQPLAQRLDASVSQLVIAWTFSQPGVTHVLCGARTVEQVASNAAAGDLQLSDDDLEMIDAVVASLPTI